MANIFGKITDFLGGGDISKGQKAQNQASEILRNTQNPDLMALIPQLQMQVQQGTMTPAQAEAAIQEATNFANISTDPSLAADQLQQIEQLKRLATQGGITDIDRAQLMQIQNEIASKNKAQQDALQTEFAQRGQGGSGASMQAKMLASQGTANSGAMAGTQVASNAQQRALQALQMYGQRAQDVQGQQFSQQAQKAAAADAIARFNAENRQAVNTLNANNQTAANKTNFDMANQIAGKNTETTNENLKMPLTQANQQFTNTLNKNIATANALRGQGTSLIGQGNTQAGNTGSALQGIASGVGEWLGGGTGNPQGTSGNNPSAYTAPKSGGMTQGLVSTGLQAAGSAFGIPPGVSAAFAKPVTKVVKKVGKKLKKIFSDEDLKEDIHPGDEAVEEMMSKLTGHTFKYKDDAPVEDTDSTHIGVMADDAKKAGLTVSDEGEGKMIHDDAKMKGATLAALNNLHRRVEKMERK